MIKSTELRIGNLLKRHDGSFFKVTADDISVIDDVNLYYNPLGIPITEDILLNLGFKKDIENAGNLICFKLSIITHSRKDLTIAKWVKNNKIYWQIWIERHDLTRICFVHQLQNLIFALSNQELDTSKLI